MLFPSAHQLNLLFIVHVERLLALQMKWQVRVFTRSAKLIE
jgi:hypothetical protein